MRRYMLAALVMFTPLLALAQPSRLPPVAQMMQQASARAPLAPDAAVPIRLNRGQVAFLRIAPEAGGDFVVITRRLGRGTDTVLQAIDARGNVVAEDDDGGSESLASRIEVSAADAVALIRVSLLGDAPGSFEVLLTRSAPAPAQTFVESITEAAQAAPIALGQAQPIRLRRGQNAFYRLPDGNLIAQTRALAQGTDTVLTVLDAAGRELVTDDDGGEESLASLVEVDAAQRRPLFLRASILGGGAGRFELVVNEAPPEPPARFPTSLTAAATVPAIPVGQAVAITLSRRQNAYFRLPDDARDLVATTRALADGTDTVLTLLDANGVELATDDDGGEQPLSSSLDVPAAQRRPAYLRAGVLGNGGGTFELILDVEPPRTGPAFPTSIVEAAQAPAITLGTAVPLRLRRNQQAFFRLPDGDLIALTRALGNATDTVLALVDGSGTVIAEDDDGGGGLASRLEIAASEARPLFLRAGLLAGSGGAGSFEVLVEADKTEPSAPFGASIAAATPLPVGQTLSIRLRRGEEAFFRLPEGSLVAFTQNLRANTDTVLALLDAQGNVIAEDDDGGGGLASRLAIQQSGKSGPSYLRASILGGGAGGFELVLQQGRR
ncbi:hypothetical protein [Plastoroseomonas arctica]|uniref:Uncharacterized protein n=1 Tax=Plastoroseomonas arctica TaxID=1509237 RepID=A0AAF1K5L7_9PROT|nr:hypothetical protein [Plastoroseomonas arctica]MBR0656720.1 hypothetical protein [Plastoroseomonas arctica]